MSFSWLEDKSTEEKNLGIAESFGSRLTWDVVRVKASTVNMKKALEGNARIGFALNKDHSAKLAARMRAGDSFAMGWARHEAGEVITSIGLHRTNAWINDLGQKWISYYIFHTDNTKVRDAMEVRSNRDDILELNDESAQAVAAGLIQGRGFTVQEAANCSNVTVPILKNYLRRMELKQILLSSGLVLTRGGENVISNQCYLHMRPLVKQVPVLIAVAASAVKERLTAAEVKELVKRIGALDTEAEKKSDVDLYTKAHRAIRLAPKNGPLPRRNSFWRMVNALNNAISNADSMAELQLTRLSDIQEAKRVLSSMNRNVMKKIREAEYELE